MFENVEFTDRYGGRLPSWLRACFVCEAMGCYPDGQGLDGPFKTCEACRGTGRVSWWRSVIRIPRWIVKGAEFIRWAMQPGVNPPEWSRWKCLKTAFWCSFGADLTALWR